MMETKKKKKIKHSTDTEIDMKGRETMEEDRGIEMDGKDEIVTRGRDPKKDTKSTEAIMETGRETTEIGEETTVETEMIDPHGDMKEMIDPRGDMKETNTEIEADRKETIQTMTKWKEITKKQTKTEKETRAWTHANV